MTQATAERHTFKSLRRAGDIKSRDLYRVRYTDLVVVPGQSGRNTRTQRYLDSIASLVAYMRKGGKVPPLEVRVNPETGAVEIVQGHRRRECYNVTIPEKQAELRAMITPEMSDDARKKVEEKIDDLEFVECVPFDGNDLQRVVRITTGNDSLDMTEVEVADNYGRLEREFNLSADEIADLLARPVKHVKMHLQLHHADHAVKQAVEDGKIAMTEALELIAKHGSKAAEVIGNEHAKAVKSGKTKVTKGTMRGFSYPRAALDSAAAGVTAFRKSLAEGHLEAINSYRDDGSDTVVTIQASVLSDLLAAADPLKAAEEKAEARHLKQLQKNPPAPADDDEL